MVQRGEEAAVDNEPKTRGRKPKEKKPRSAKQLANDKAQSERFKKIHEERKAALAAKKEQPPLEPVKEEPPPQPEPEPQEEKPVVQDSPPPPQPPTEDESESEPEVEEETVIIKPKPKKKKKPIRKRTYVVEPSDDESESESEEEPEQLQRPKLRRSKREAPPQPDNFNLIFR